MLERDIETRVGGSAATRMSAIGDLLTLLDDCSQWFDLPAEAHLGLRTALTLPLPPPPQKNVSPPFDSSPDTLIPGGMSICSRTSPDLGSTRRSSLCSASQVPCQSSLSTQVTPVTKRFDSMVRMIAPVCGSTW